jgi:peptidyl-tRNA hydrolase, PTH2 family
MKRVKILVRKNLKMTPGKMAAQCVHAAIGLGVKDPLISVVVLEVSDKKFNEKYEDTIRKLSNYLHQIGTSPILPEKSYVVKDAGFTELPPGTITCMAFYEEDPRVK